MNGIVLYKKFSAQPNKKNITEQTSQSTGENICQIFVRQVMDNQIYKELKIPNVQTANDQISKWTNKWNNHF